MEFSMEEAYQRKLNSNVIRWRKIFAVIRLIHKYLSDFYCRKRTFSRGTKSINASEEALSKYWLNRCYQRRFSTIRNPFSWVERTREVGNLAYGTRCYLARWSCFLLPLTTTVDSTFVAGASDENDRSEIALLSAGTRHDITQEHQGISLGATRRALP